MRWDLIPGELVEIKVSAATGVLANEWGVLQGNTLLWEGKRGWENLL